MNSKIAGFMNVGESALLRIPLLAACLLGLASGGSAFACSCASWPSAKQAFQSSPVVFVGRVEKTDPPTGGNPQFLYLEQTVWVRVEEPFKGVKVGQILTLSQPSHGCAPKFKEGERTLLYLNPSKKLEFWQAYGCHRSRGLESAAEDLLFLRALPGSMSKNRLSGVVQLYEESTQEGFRKKQALAGVSITITGDGAPVRTATNSDGVYEIYDLPPGKYKVDLAIPKGMKLNFASLSGLREAGLGEQEIRLDKTSGVNVNFVVMADNEISGIVLDPQGKPMKDVCVELQEVQTLAGEGSRISDCSKQDGRYVLSRMSAGQYRIVANRSGEITAQEPFPTTYYPGTTEREKAAVVTIGEGEHKSGLDIRIAKLMDRVTVRGRVVYLDGKPAAGEHVRFDAGPGPGVHVETKADGSFELLKLANQPGELRSEILFFRHEAAACPQFGAAFNTSTMAVTLTTQSVQINPGQDVEGVHLVYPFRSCEKRNKGHK